MAQAHRAESQLPLLLSQVLVAFTVEIDNGLEPYADGWRASVRRPVTLPHYCMVLHRGVYLDGS